MDLLGMRLSEWRGSSPSSHHPSRRSRRSSRRILRPATGPNPGSLLRGLDLHPHLPGTFRTSEKHPVHAESHIGTAYRPGIPRCTARAPCQMARATARTMSSWIPSRHALYCRAPSSDRSGP